MPDGPAGFAPVTALRVRARPVPIAIAGGSAMVALVCLGDMGNAVSVVAFIDAVLVLSWILAATAIAHFCGGQRLLLKPPQMHGDFRQLSGFRVELKVGNGARRLPVLFASVRLDTSTEGVPLVSPAVFTPALPARAQLACAWDISVRKRGEVELRGARVELAFPGSMVGHDCSFAFAHRKLALPALFRLDNRALEMLGGRRRSESRTAVTAASLGDFVGVRDYRPGDNPRDVHLALSTRLPDFPVQLAVREFEDTSTADIHVVLDTLMAPDEADAGTLNYNHEVGLSFAAAFCRLLLEKRYQVSFHAVDGATGPLEIELRQPGRDLPRLEASLALLLPSSDRSAVTRLIGEAHRRGGAAVFYIGLREGVRGPRGVYTIEPAMQRRLVSEVLAA